MAGEFDLIRLYAPTGAVRNDVVLGSGDDAALLQLPAGRQLVATVDTLVAGRHFPLQTRPFDIGWKSLAVNLSDLAAMGADAAWATVALTLPDDLAPDDWMAGFSAGLQALAEETGVAIVGGDLTAGPLSVTVQALGHVAPQSALRRDTARPGDVVAVTGNLGDAALALQMLQAGEAVPEVLLERLNRPRPRLTQGQALAGRAHAAIDISDGLAADLGHILEASGVGARIELGRLPQSEAFSAHCPPASRVPLALAGGDDYELCLCLPSAVAREMSACLTVIGEITSSTGLELMDTDGRALAMDQLGYDHFAN